MVLCDYCVNLSYRLYLSKTFSTLNKFVKLGSFKSLRFYIDALDLGLV
jgi:hypothetical protein